VKEKEKENMSIPSHLTSRSGLLTPRGGRGSAGAGISGSSGIGGNAGLGRPRATRSKLGLVEPLFGIVGDDGVRQLRLALRSSKAVVDVRNLAASISFEQLYANQSSVELLNASFFFSAPVKPSSTSDPSSSWGGFTIPNVTVALHSFEAEIVKADGSRVYIVRQESSATSGGSAPSSRENSPKSERVSTSSSSSSSEVGEISSQEGGSSLVSELKISIASVSLGTIPAHSVLVLKFSYVLELPLTKEGIELFLPSELISPHRPSNWRDLEDEDEDEDEDNDCEDEDPDEDDNSNELSANDLLNKYYRSSSSSSSIKEDTKKGPYSLQYNTSITVNIDMPRNIRHIECSASHAYHLQILEPNTKKDGVSLSLHPLPNQTSRNRSQSYIVKKQTNNARQIDAQRAVLKVDLKGENALIVNKDFSLIIKTDDAMMVSRASLERGDMLFAQVVLHNIAPTEPNEIVFLVDRSGSMAGARIEIVKRTLQLFLRRLSRMLRCMINTNLTYSFRL